MQTEHFALVAIALAVLLILIAPRFAGRTSYELRAGLLTPGERAFYRALLASVGSEYLVATKVRVADVLKPTGTNRRNALCALNRIAQKHFDFVLCDPSTLEFKAAVELDDKSHRRRKRVERDAFLNDATASAGLTLYRFQAKSTYTVAEIRDAIFASRTGVHSKDARLKSR